MVRASDDDLAQFSLVERVERGAAARLPVTDFKPAVGQDPIAQSRLFDAVAAMRVALAPGQKDGAGGDDLRPPAVIGVALVVDVGGTGLQRDGAAGHNIVDLGRSHVEPYRAALPRIMQHMQFQPACARIGLGPRKTIAFERDRRGIEQSDQSFSLRQQSGSAPWQCRETRPPAAPYWRPTRSSGTASAC